MAIENIHVSGRILGGPMDGEILDYVGETDCLEIKELMSEGGMTLEYKGHRYKITEFDVVTNHAVFIW